MPFIYAQTVIQRNGAVSISFRTDILSSLVLNLAKKTVKEHTYPRTLKITAYYSLSEDNELAFEYRAVTEEATPVNLT